MFMITPPRVSFLILAKVSRARKYRRCTLFSRFSMNDNISRERSPCIFAEYHCSTASVPQSKVKRFRSIVESDVFSEYVTAHAQLDRPTMSLNCPLLSNSFLISKCTQLCSLATVFSVSSLISSRISFARA